MTSEDIRDRIDSIELGKITHSEWALCDICEALLRRIEKLEESQKAIGSELSQHLNE